MIQRDENTNRGTIPAGEITPIKLRPYGINRCISSPLKNAPGLHRYDALSRHQTIEQYPGTAPKFFIDVETGQVLPSQN